MREIRRSCPRPLRLHFSSIDFATDGPRDTEYYKIYEHGHYDNPASAALGGVDASRGVKDTDEEHGETYAHSTGDHARPPAPFIGEDGRWDGDTYDDDGGYARGEKAGCVAADASLLENERCVLLCGSACFFAFPISFRSIFRGFNSIFCEISIVPVFLLMQDSVQKILV
jgi:hypothetical protein